MEGVIDQLVNTAGASEQCPELQCLRKLLDTDREGARQTKLSFPPAMKTALRAKLQQERRVKLLARSRRQSSKRPTHRTTRLLDHRRNSTKRARRSSQTNLESIYSRHLPKSAPVPCDQKKVTNALLQLFQAFQTQLALHTSSALGRRGRGSARETTRSWGPKRRVTPSSNQDWRWLESRPLTSSFPLTERQRHWTRPPPGRNDRAESVSNIFFHSMGGTHTVVHRWHQTCHGFWAPPGGPDVLPEPSASSDTSTITLRNAGKASTRQTVVKQSLLQIMDGWVLASSWRRHFLWPKTLCPTLRQFSGAACRRARFMP